MLISYKDREVKVGQLVKVYFHFHKKVFSIKDYKSNLVLAHGDHIQIKNPQFVVMEKGREKVLKEKIKNVHAYVVGEIYGIGELDFDVKNQYELVNYNPYEVDQFKVGNSNLNASSRGYEWAILENEKVFAR